MGDAQMGVEGVDAVYTMTGDGKDMTVDITFKPDLDALPMDDNSPSNSRTETLTLTLALDANMRYR